MTYPCDKSNILEIANSLLSFCDALRTSAEVEVDLLNRHIQLRTRPLHAVELSLRLTQLLLKPLKLAHSLVAIALVLLDHLRRDGLRLQLRAHAAPHYMSAASGHRARRVDELPGECDDAPPALAAERDAVRLVEVVRDQRVADALPECRGEPGLLRLDEVEQPRDVLRGRDLVHVVRPQLLEDHEGGTADLLSAQVLYASLALLDGVNDHVVQCSAGCGNRYIVLVRDGSKATKATLRETAHQH